MASTKRSQTGRRGGNFQHSGALRHAGALRKGQRQPPHHRPSRINRPSGRISTNLVVCPIKNKMKERILMNAKFHKSNRSFAAAAALLAGLGLVTLTHAQTGANPRAPTPAPAGGPARPLATPP